MREHLGREDVPPANGASFDYLVSLFESTGSDFHVVFDDFHNIYDSQGSKELIEKLLEDLPSRVSVFILSRTSVGISLSRFRSRQELLELNEKDLRFTVNEISSLIKDVFQLKLDDNTILKIDKLLQGWVTGYIFLIEKLSNMLTGEEQQQYLQTFLNRGNRDEYFEFLESEVISAFSKCEKNILISLSPFSSVTPDLGMSIGGKEGANCLKRIIHDSNFIEPDSKRPGTYRFHPILSDYLNILFNELPDDRKTSLLRKTIPFLKRKTMCRT